jgi:iron complex transport system substrate-binding protein
MKKYLILIIALPFMVFAMPQKVVSLGGDITEIVYALGAQSQLVGRDSTSTWPAAVKKLPDVGYMRQLNIEGILSLQPTMVIASRQAQPSSVLSGIADNHVQVINVTDDYTLPAIMQKVAVIASALGKTEEGQILQEKIAAQISAIPMVPVNKRVLFLLSHGGMGTMVAGQETAADSAIRIDGLQNAMQGFAHYRPLSAEGVIASKPDLIVISADSINSIGGEKNLWQLPGLAQTPAGLNKQVLIVDDMALLGFSLRTPQTLISLRKKAEQLQ